MSENDAGGPLPAQTVGEDDGATLPEDLRHALERVATAERLLVAMDFDGTMAPLVDRAEDARALPRSAQAFAELAALPATTTALISGRALDTLRLLASPGEKTLLIGSHGAETWTGPDRKPLELDVAARELLAQATAVVERIVEAHPGTHIETKPAGVVLHTRTAEPDVAAAAVETALRELNGLDGLSVTEGKKVVESSVVHSDKGQGIETLRSLTGATAVLFAGDDVTDEHAMAVLGPEDVGVKIGSGLSRAGYRIESPEQVQDLLETLLKLRATVSR
ncbi:trehalose-phosphatase [Arthrobacter monumenti]